MEPSIGIYCRQIAKRATFDWFLMQSFFWWFGITLANFTPAIPVVRFGD
jgi:hypothetical protein